jgi:protein tyrosine phosphatase
MSGTIDDFWQMIWEQQIKVVVMVTSLMEKDRVRLFFCLFNVGVNL